MSNIDVVIDEVLRSRKNGVRLNVSALARSNGVHASSVFARLKKERVKETAAKYGAVKQHPNAKPEILALKTIHVTTGAPTYSKEFHDAIVNEHLDHHITQFNLSEIYGISLSTINNWCRSEILKRELQASQSETTETVSEPVVNTKVERMTALLAEYEKLTIERDEINKRRSKIMGEIALLTVS